MSGTARQCSTVARPANRLLPWATALLGLLVAQGCSSSEPAAPQGPGQVSEGQEQPQSADEHSTGESRIEGYMEEHFVLATYARDAVIDGDLEALRGPLRELASQSYDEVVPGGWLPWVAMMQQSARLVADASDLDKAASGVAAMARTCGECHRAVGGPSFSPLEMGTETRATEAVGERMFRHMWAADRMWKGLVGPSDAAWEAGARTLVGAPAHIDNGGERLNQLLSQVRALGQQAAEATQPAQRADVYGLFLASCADCHKRLPPPSPSP